MTKFDFGEELKRIMLAGVGAVAETSEKASALLDHLVEKGEITVEQGKAINEELKRNIKDCIKPNEKAVPTVDNVVDDIKDLSKDDLAALKEKLDALDVFEEDDNTAE